MNIAGKTFLITGGSSLVGSRIARQLLDSGAKALTLFDNLSLGSTSAMDDLLADERVEFVRGDILDVEQLAAACGGVDGIFALAAFLTIPLGKNPSLGLRVNVDGMANTLEAARRAEVAKVVMASSISVYGDNLDGLVDEDFAFGSATLSPPFALYALSKLIGEQLGRLYSDRYGVDFCAVRFSTVYGERQHDRGVNALQIVETYEAIRGGTVPTIVGTGDDAHDFIYVGDAASGAIRAMEVGVTGTSYTIATGTATTSKELVRTVIKVAGSHVEPDFRDDDRSAAPTLHPELRLDIGRAHRELGWNAEVPLEDGITRLVGWLDGARA